MRLRGITRAAAAVAATALLVGGFGAPARAEEEDVDFPGAILNIGDSGVWAASAPKKGCEGIDTGVAVTGKDGWLFSKPAGEYKDLQYVLFYFTGPFDEPTEIYPLILNADGVFTFAVSDVDANPEDLAKALTAKVAPQAKAAGATNIELPQAPPPAGVTGKLVDGGGWVKSPAGWGLGFGAAITLPLLNERITFDLVRACAAAAAPSASPSSPAPSTPGGPSLPVTGTNVWILSGVGTALIVAGAVIFMAYRRRQNIKFVA